jgi:MFS family permease
MVGTFLALALGQLLIARADISAATPFNAIVVLFAVALILVTTARAEPPRLSEEAMLPYGVLTQAAPIAVLGCALSGLVGGCFYALVPAWMQDQGTPRNTIALFMLVAVLGGFAFQIPVGRLSDRFDRRTVLALLGLGFAGTAFVMVLLPRSLPTILPAAVLLGGFMSTLYPVCVAHAHDSMPADRVLAVSGRLILVSGVGSVLGPLIGGTSFEWGAPKKWLNRSARIRPARSAAPVCVPTGTVVSVTSVNRLKTRTSNFDQHVEAPAPNTIIRLRPRKGP